MTKIGRGILALSFIVLGAEAARAQGPPFPGKQYPTGIDPYALALGDFNADGFPDVVTADFNSDAVSVFLGLGDDGLSSASAFGVGLGPFGIAVGDLNGDGKLDFVTSNEV